MTCTALNFKKAIDLISLAEKIIYQRILYFKIFNNFIKTEILKITAGVLFSKSLLTTKAHLRLDILLAYYSTNPHKNLDKPIYNATIGLVICNKKDSRVEGTYNN